MMSLDINITKFIGHAEVHITFHYLGNPHSTGARIRQEVWSHQAITAQRKTWTTSEKTWSRNAISLAVSNVYALAN